MRADSCAILCPQYWTKQHAAYNTRSPDPCRILPAFLLQFLKPTFLETPRDTLSSTECPLEGHLTAGKSGKGAKMTCVSLHFPPSHTASHTHSWGAERPASPVSSPFFSPTDSHSQKKRSGQELH